jgi:hypothetical protein
VRSIKPLSTWIIAYWMTKDVVLKWRSGQVGTARGGLSALVQSSDRSRRPGDLAIWLETAIWEASGKAGLSELGNCSGLLPPLLNRPPTSAESATRLGMRGLAQLDARALHNIPEAAGGNLSAQCWTPTGRGEGSCRRSQSRPRNTRCSGRCPPLCVEYLQQHRRITIDNKSGP